MNTCVNTQEQITCSLSLLSSTCLFCLPFILFFLSEEWEKSVKDLKNKLFWFSVDRSHTILFPFLLLFFFFTFKSDIWHPYNEILCSHWKEWDGFECMCYVEQSLKCIGQWNIAGYRTVCLMYSYLYKLLKGQRIKTCVCHFLKTKQETGNIAELWKEEQVEQAFEFHASCMCYLLKK